MTRLKSTGGSALEVHSRQSRSNPAPHPLQTRSTSGGGAGLQWLWTGFDAKGPAINSQRRGPRALHHPPRGKKCAALPRLLPNDFAGGFVVPQPEKEWVAEMAIASPFRKADLGDQFRSYPPANLHFAGP